MFYKADLHIHSCLSPCGSLEMSPARIVQEAKKQRLDLIALTDHNNTRNIPAFASLCRKAGIAALYGMEVSSSEEIHCLCLFETIEAAGELGSVVEDHLPEIPNNPDLFGDQVYVDESENILGEFVPSLLQSAEITLEELHRETTRLGGLFIPAHIDRPSFSLISQLGFLPDLAYSALECVHLPPPVECGSITLVRNSDAHRPEDIGSRHFCFEAEEASFPALRRALEEGKVKPQGCS